MLIFFLLCYVSFFGTLQFDLMLDKKLFTFTLFLMGINDSVLDQIGFQTICRNKLWSKTDVPLYERCLA